jgi:hypothetical protein
MSALDVYLMAFLSQFKRASAAWGSGGWNGGGGSKGE